MIFRPRVINLSGAGETIDELRGMAQHFTALENVANKVERQVGKPATLPLRLKIGSSLT